MTQNISDAMVFNKVTEESPVIEIPYKDSRGNHLPITLPGAPWEIFMHMLDFRNPVYPALFKGALLLDREEMEMLGNPKDYTHPNSAALMELMEIIFTLIPNLDS